MSNGQFRLIGLVGIAGCGKSTIADEIVKQEEAVGRRAIRVSFAGGVKKGLLDAFPEFFTDHDVYSQEGKAAVNTHLSCTNRHVLQQFGTDFARAIHQDFWVKLLEARWLLPNLKSDVTLIIDDCRFQNEIDFIRKWGGRVYFVERNVSVAHYKRTEWIRRITNTRDHESERCYLLYNPEVHNLIPNTGGLDDIRQICGEILEDFRWYDQNVW